MSFQEYVSNGFSHTVFYGDLVYKLRRVKCQANFVLLGSKIGKRLRSQEYDLVIIKRTIDRVLCPSTALYRSFLKHCTLTNKAVGTIWRHFSKPPQIIHGPGPRPFWLLFGTPGVLGLELASTRAEHSIFLWMSLYTSIFDILFDHLTCLCNNIYGLSAFVGCWSSLFIRAIIYKFLKVCPFLHIAFVVSGKDGIP